MPPLVSPPDLPCCWPPSTRKRYEESKLTSSAALDSKSMMMLQFVEKYQLVETFSVCFAVHGCKVIFFCSQCFPEMFMKTLIRKCFHSLFPLSFQSCRSSEKFTLRTSTRCNKTLRHFELANYFTSDWIKRERTNGRENSTAFDVEWGFYECRELQRLKLLKSSGLSLNNKLFLTTRCLRMFDEKLPLCSSRLEDQLVYGEIKFMRSANRSR